MLRFHKPLLLLMCTFAPISWANTAEEKALDRRYAITNRRTVTYSEPSGSAWNAGSVPRNTKVEVLSLSTKKLWIKIRTPDEKEGWIPIHHSDFSSGDVLATDRKYWGAWVQGGPSWVNQDFRGLTNSKGQQLSGQVQVGIQVSNFHVEGSWRERIATISNTVALPRWLNLFLGYHFELGHVGPTLWHFYILGGWEKYKNSSTQTAPALRISDYSSPSAGFRSRVSLGSIFDVGGDFLYMPVSNGQKYFLQADARYWMQPSLAIGLGFYFDRVQVVIPQVAYDETSIAPTLYLRYQY